MNQSFWIRIGHWMCSSRNFYRFLFWYGIFLVSCAFFGEGWFQADEHARVLEPAYFLVYKYATLPWEFLGSKPMVSYLLGLIHTPVLYVTRAFDVSGTTDAFLERMYSGHFSATKLIAFYKMLPYLVKKKRTCWLVFSALCLLHIHPNEFGSNESGKLELHNASVGHVLVFEDTAPNVFRT